MPLLAVTCAVVLVPWDIVPWPTPLPATVQEQVDAAAERGLDGIIVYVARAGKAPASSGSLSLALDKPADFEPDARYSYSNTNYLLLGRILDGALGYPQQRYIEREILAPLGLTHTYPSLGQANERDVVRGYWYGYDDDLTPLDHAVPGGSMVATAQDVGTFPRALNDGSLLSADEQAIYASIYRYGHTGWLPGYYSIARYHADIDAVVVQFVNTTGGDAWRPVEVTGGKALGISNIIYGRIVRILRRQVSPPT